MIRARRWAYWIPLLAWSVIIGVVGWKAGLVFLGVIVTIRVETNRVLATIWPESYHAVRKGVEDDRELRT